MSSPATTKQFTLGDLAKIALGATELTHEHLSVLQSLLIILLQKLNCHNESVRIKGFSAKCIQTLCNSNTNSGKYSFQLESVKRFEEKYELLEKLEQKTKDIDLKLQQHFEIIRRCHKTHIFHSLNWDYYAAFNEDLCSLYMQHNKEICLLARNSIFNRELRRNLYPKVLELFKEFEAKIEGMQNKLKDILLVSEEAAGKEKCIELIVNNIENIRFALQQKDNTFRKTMLECQEMLNCKLERVTLPAMKIYLEQRFGEIRDQLKVLKIESTKCPYMKPLVIENKKTCLSCGRHEECRSSKMSQKSIAGSKKCFCSNLWNQSTILEKIDRMKLSEQNLALPTRLPVSPIRISRTGSVKKSSLEVHSPGVLGDKAISNQLPKPVGVNISIMKSTLKIPKELESEEGKSEGLEVFFS